MAALAALLTLVTMLPPTSLSCSISDNEECFFEYDECCGDTCAVKLVLDCTGDGCINLTSCKNFTVMVCPNLECSAAGDEKLNCSGQGCNSFTVGCPSNADRGQAQG